MKGHPQALTSNMDRLAARGMLFRNAHCAAPACNPSRAAIFSGQMPNVTKVGTNDSGLITKVHPSARYLTTAFEESGYQTLGTGKLLHGKSSKQLFQTYHGIEQRWSPLRSKTDTHYTQEELPTKGTNTPRHITKNSQGHEVILPLNRMPSDRAPDDPKGESFDWGGFDVPDPDFGDTQITDWAIEKLRKPSDKPLFLGVDSYRPHIPLWAPKRFFEHFKDDPGKLPVVLASDLDDLSETARKWALEPVTAGSHATVTVQDQWRQAVEAYLAYGTYVDHEIGRLLEALDNSSLGDHTMIVLWSDHSWHLGEKEHWGKWTGWERSAKVPLIIVPPKNQADRFHSAGAVCQQPVGLIDLYPTLVEFCELKGSDQLDGKSLVPMLRDPKSNFRKATLTMFDEGNASLRDARWRYIRYADGNEELYDVIADPNEWNNQLTFRG
jgi:arylsulfatase A-like enzyme